MVKKISGDQGDGGDEGNSERHDTGANLVALFGAAQVEVKSRGEGADFLGDIANLSIIGITEAIQAGVADLLNSKSMANLTKPAKDDFSDEAEYQTALAEFTAEKSARKVAMWEGLHSGDIPTFTQRSWVSPLRLEIDRIVLSNLTTYFSGTRVRTSTPARAYTLPNKSSKDYKALSDKWLAKYGEEIAAEAKENVANGVVTEVSAGASVDVEF